MSDLRARARVLAEDVIDYGTASVEAITNAIMQGMVEALSEAALHFDKSHREWWSPEIVEELRAMAVLNALKPMLFKQWVGLTDAEINGLSWMRDMSLEEEVELIRGVEAKLKDKNT